MTTLPVALSSTMYRWGRGDVVEGEDPVDVRPVHAGLDVADHPLEQGGGALRVTAVEGREPGSGGNHRDRLEVPDDPAAEGARHADGSAATDQPQRVDGRGRSGEVQNVVRPVGPRRAQQPAVVEEDVVNAGRDQGVGAAFTAIVGTTPGRHRAGS
jgi:hypothetical protein